MSNVSSGCSAFFACCLINHHTITAGSRSLDLSLGPLTTELLSMNCFWSFVYGFRMFRLYWENGLVYVSVSSHSRDASACDSWRLVPPTGVNPILALRRQRQPTALCCRTPALHAPIRHECNASFCCIFPADSDKSCHWSGGGRPSYKFYPLFATLLTLARNQSSNGQRRDLSL